MRSFEEYVKKVNLTRYLGSDLGTMYFEPDLPEDKDYIIRHLDSELTEEMLPVYVDLYKSIKNWIETNSKINEFVFMNDLIEVGKDYIIRPFRVYIKSNRSYFDDDQPIEPPIRYFEMLIALSEEMLRLYVDYEELYPTKETIIKRILRKSLIAESGKTIYDNNLNKFELVEPRISIDNIEEWQKL